MEPSQCRTCGQAIIWTKRNDDPKRWNRPLDVRSATKGFCVVDKVVHVTDCYQIHLCDPRDVQIQDEQTRMENAVVGVEDPPYVRTVPESVRFPAPILTPVVAPSGTAATAEDVVEEPRKYTTGGGGRAAVAEIALSVTCPWRDCGAGVGEPCWDLPERSDGRDIARDWPHFARRIAGRDHLGITSTPNWCSDDEGLRQDADAHDRGMQKIESRQRVRTALADLDARALKYKCPSCGASRNIDCWNLIQRKKGVKLHTARPHAERLELAPKKL